MPQIPCHTIYKKTNATADGLESLIVILILWIQNSLIIILILCSKLVILDVASFDPPLPKKKFLEVLRRKQSRWPIITLNLWIYLVEI